MLKIKSSQNHSQYRRKFMFKILIFQSKELILRNNPAQSISCVQVFVTPWIIACQALQSMGILKASILEWVAIPSSRGSFQPRSPTLQVDSLPAEPQGKPKNTGVGSLSLFQGIFLIQESNWGLLLCRWILYQLSYQGMRMGKFIQMTITSTTLGKNSFKKWNSPHSQDESEMQYSGGTSKITE